MTESRILVYHDSGEDPQNGSHAAHGQQPGDTQWVDYEYLNLLEFDNRLDEMVRVMIHEARHNGNESHYGGGGWMGSYSEEMDLVNMCMAG